MGEMKEQCGETGCQREAGRAEGRLGGCGAGKDSSVEEGKPGTLMLSQDQRPKHAHTLQQGSSADTATRAAEGRTHTAGASFQMLETAGMRQRDATCQPSEPGKVAVRAGVTRPPV